MTPNDYLVDRLVTAQLRDNPRTRSIYNSDAMFHASVELHRKTLSVVATEMGDVGIPAGQIEAVLRTTLDRMLSDRVLDEHDEMVNLAARPLWEKLMDR
jgi:hypothetical protein